MIGYVVTIEVTPDDPHDSSGLMDQRLDELADRITGWHGVLSGDHTGWSATVTIDADHPVHAQQQAATLVLGEAGEVHLPTGPVTRIETVREDVRDADLERPNLPDLVSGPEAATILDVSRQRLWKLAHERADFPKPAYSLAVGDLYHRAAIERFNETWQRRPGRPAATDRQQAA